MKIDCGVSLYDLETSWMRRPWPPGGLLRQKQTNKRRKRETAVAQWLRCCATNRKVAGSIPAGVIGIFHWHKILPIALWPWGRLSLWQKWVTGAFPGGKGGRCVRLTLPLPCAVNFLEPSGPLQSCNGTDLLFLKEGRGNRICIEFLFHQTAFTGFRPAFSIKWRNRAFWWGACCIFCSFGFVAMWWFFPSFFSLYYINLKKYHYIMFSIYVVLKSIFTSKNMPQSLQICALPDRIPPPNLLYIYSYEKIVFGYALSSGASRSHKCDPIPLSGPLYDNSEDISTSERGSNSVCSLL